MTMGTRQILTTAGLLAALWLGAGCQPPGAKAMFKGEELLEANQPKAAAAQFEEATKLLPKDWRAWNYLGLARHRAGDLAGSQEAYQKAIELVGNRRYSKSHPSAVLEFNIGRLYLDQNQTVEALNRLMTFAEQDQSFSSCYWLAEAYRVNGNFEGAEVMLKRALEKQPKSAVAWNRLGTVQLALKDSTNALTSFQTALKHDKKFYPAQGNIAVLLHRYAPEGLADHEALALEAYEAYLSHPDAETAEVSHAMAELKAILNPPELTFHNGTNSVAGAETNLPPAVLVIPEPPLAPLRPSNIVVQVPTTRTNGGAIGVVPTNIVPRPPPTIVAATNTRPVPPENTVVIVPPEAPQPPPESTRPVVPPTAPVQPGPRPQLVVPEKVRPVVPNIAGIARYSYKQPARPAPTKSGPARKAFEQAAHAHGLNQLDKAIAGYRQVLQLDPGVQQAHHNLALALQAKGQLKEALAEFEVALAINPLSRESRQGFAAALNSSNFYIDAAREYQVLLQTFPNHGPAHLDLAGVYANHLKMSAEAKAHYRRALELAPNHQQAPAIRAWLAQQP